MENVTDEMPSPSGAVAVRDETLQLLEMKISIIREKAQSLPHYALWNEIAEMEKVIDPTFHIAIHYSNSLAGALNADETNLSYSQAVPSKAPSVRSTPEIRAGAKKPGAHRRRKGGDEKDLDFGSFMQRLMYMSAASKTGEIVRKREKTK
jgi:hypothetical protein